MAPYRNNRTSARSNRTTQIDHDVFEGLPVRHWRKKSVGITVLPEREAAKTLRVLSTGYAELPKPRDFDMLPEASRLLLQAARMGLRKETPIVEDEKEQADDDEARVDDDAGLIARRWALVPRELEGPEPEYLAKRRKGLPSVYSGITALVDGPTQMRKTKIRKINDEGKDIILEVLVPEGQRMDGEICEEEVTPTQPPAPGTLVEGLGVVNADGLVVVNEETPNKSNRKKPPVPKKKFKGPGRGRKKKVAFMPGAEGSASNDGSTPETQTMTSTELLTNGTHRNPNGNLETDKDIVMQDIARDGEDSGEEGSEGEEEGDDGERDEGEVPSSPDQEGSKSPSKSEDPTALKSTNETKDFALTPSMARETAQSPALQSRDQAAASLQSEIESGSDSMLLDEEVTLHEPESGNGVLVSDTSEATPTSKTAAHGPLEGTLHLEAEVSIQNTDIAIMPAIETGPEPFETAAGAAKRDDPLMQQPLVDDTPDAALLNSPVPTSPLRAEEAAPQPEQTVPSPSTKSPKEIHTEAAAPSTPGENVTEGVSDISLPQVQQLSSQNRLELSEDIELSPSLQVPVKKPVEISSHTRESQQIAPFQQTPSLSADQLRSPSPPPQTTRLPAELRAPSPPLPIASRTSTIDPRPTISTPKAPTPSPPTPIETSFDLLPPMLSPKAPTMSPPTPIERDVSSSPDRPLSGQFPHAQLPQPTPFRLDPEGEELTASVSSVQSLSPSKRVAVEAAPLVEPQINAEVPHNHNPLDGLAAPQQLTDQVGANELTGNAPIVRFDDGEEDLLGTFENMSQKGAEY